MTLAIRRTHARRYAFAIAAGLVVAVAGFRSAVNIGADGDAGAGTPSRRLAGYDVYVWDQCYAMEQSLRID